jgi:hypothetical protein
MSDLDASLVQQVLYITERQREPDVEHHRQKDYLGAGLEVAERGASGHLEGRPGAPVASSQFLLTTPSPAFSQTPNKEKSG